MSELHRSNAVWFGAVRMNFQPKTMSTTDACRYLSVGKTTLYQLVKDKKLKLLKLGGKSLVLTAELDNLIESLTKEAA